MPTTPPTITALGTPPSSQDSANFDARADTLLGALPTFVTETNALADNVYDNAVEAAASAAASDASADASAASALTSAANAAAAAASAGGSAWASGSYTTGTRAISPSNQRLYRRLSPGGSSPTDPASDPTNWAAVPIGLPTVTVSGTTGTARPNERTRCTNSAAVALTVSTMVADDLIEIDFSNGRRDNSFDIGAMTIKGPNGTTATGVITHSAGGYLRLYHDGTYLRSAR